MSQGQIEALFAQFVHLRQAGRSREQAWGQIKEAANRLSLPERQQLSNLMREWETHEGQRYAPAREDDPFSTQDEAPEGLDQARQQADNASGSRVIKRIQTSSAPGQGAPPGVECPTCHKVNRPGEAYCYSCGTLLRRPGMPAANATQPLNMGDADSSYFGDTMALYLKIQGAGETIRIQPRSSEMILGRRSPESVMIPDVDLSSFQADEKGVSRLHAGLRRQENTLVLTDLGSRNHTHINGQRLHSHEVRALHDGDELRLGQLVMYVYFGEK